MDQDERFYRFMKSYDKHVEQPTLPNVESDVKSALMFAQLRPIEVGFIERFGKRLKKVEAGLHILIPFVDRIKTVKITEQMIDVQPQTVITKDKLNAVVDAVVYYKVNDPEAAIYNVDNHKLQLVSLARTTLRSVLGKMSLTDANEKRDKINEQVEEVLNAETKTYGVDVLRVEIQKIEPPSDVQSAMNEVVKAENKKIAAKDLASATETKADGEKRAEIKKSEGLKRAAVLEAEGKAESITKIAQAKANEIEVINNSIKTHFTGSAVSYKKIESMVEALKNGTKVIVDSDTDMVNIIGDSAGVVPIQSSKNKNQSSGSASDGETNDSIKFDVGLNDAHKIR